MLVEERAQLGAEGLVLSLPCQSHASRYASGLWKKNGGIEPSDLGEEDLAHALDVVDRPRLVGRRLGERAPALEQLHHAALHLDDLAGMIARRADWRASTATAATFSGANRSKSPSFGVMYSPASASVSRVRATGAMAFTRTP